MLQDARLYSYFIAVAETLSFTLAAARLHVAQPWLSTRIRQLETKLGLDLFVRTTRSVELTEEGRALLPKARAVMEAAEEFQRTAYVLAVQAPVLRVGAPPYLAMVPTARSLMDRYVQQHPEVRLEMDVGWSKGLVQMVLSGELDAAFTLGMESREDLEEVAIDQIPIDFEFPKDDPLAEKGRVGPEDLKGRPVVMFTRNFNPFSFDKISQILLAHGASVVERKAMWSTTTSPQQSASTLAIRMGWNVDRCRANHVRRRIDFVPPMQMRLVRAQDNAMKPLDDLFRLAQAGATP